MQLHTRCSMFGINKPQIFLMRLKRIRANNLAILALNPFQTSAHMLVQIKHKTSGGRKPKKKIYHRVHELDKVMDLQKKPAVILQLKDIIQSQKSKCILLRNLEKEVGFVQKWNCMAVIEKYPMIFHVSGGSRTPISVRLTEKAKSVAAEENETWMLMEPILVKNLRKLLMLTVDCRLPLEKIDFIKSVLGLPTDYMESLILKYPEFFCVKEVNGKAYLHLESWDSSLGITAREEKMMQEGLLKDGGKQMKVKISRDGNYPGPHAFRICYAAGFRPNTGFLEEVERWQKMEFPSPYLNARRFDPADPKARKRVVSVLHELLSLTVEKRMTSMQMSLFQSELLLPARLLLCLIKHHGIFYITNKGERSTVFLKEAYDGSNLIQQCPILRFNAKFVALSGRKDSNLSNQISESSIL